MCVASRKIAILISFSIFISLQTSSEAAIKSGDSCKKLGSTATFKSTQFKCVKIKGKLIWTLINQPKVIPTASPTVSSTISSSPTPTTGVSPSPSMTVIPVPSPSESYSTRDQIKLGNFITYRLVDGKLERKSDNGEFFQSDSRKEIAFSPIRVKAFEEMTSILKTPNHPNVNFVWDIRPSFPSPIKEFKIQKAKEAAEIFNALFTSPITVKAMLATEKDVDYPPVRNQYFGDTAEQLKRVGLINKKDQLIWITGGGGYWSTEGQTIGRFFLGTPSDAEPKDYSPEWIQLSVHEFFHIVQQYLVFPMVTEAQADFNVKVPNHFREGAANFVGYVLSTPNLGWYSDAMDVSLIRYWNGIGNWMPAKTENDIVNLLKATESREDPKAFEIGYPLGSIFYEWIVGKYGYSKFIELSKVMGTSPNFSSATKKVFGMAKEDLYAEAAPYILSVFNRAVNN